MSHILQIVTKPVPGGIKKAYIYVQLKCVEKLYILRIFNPWRRLLFLSNILYIRVLVWLNIALA